MDLVNKILGGCFFFADTTFNLAHWFFAFSYLALSFRLELTSKALPGNTHNCSLNTVNITVCVFNVAIPAMVWGFDMKHNLKAEAIAYDI